MLSGLAGSVSRLSVAFSVQSKGELKGEIFRHLSPTTVGLLSRRSPLQGRLVKEEGFVSMLVNLEAGVEKGRTSFRRGEIAFFPRNGAVCFFLKDSSLSTPMNLLGRITEGLEVLEAVGPGDVGRFVVEMGMT